MNINRMKKVQTLRELQLVSISIYKDLRDFCNANGLKVYLTGGTLNYVDLSMTIISTTAGRNPSEEME